MTHSEAPLLDLNNRLFDRSSGVESSEPKAATRSHTMEFRLGGRALINARKIPGVSDTGPKEGRVPFSHVCTPRDATSISLHDPLPLLPRLLRPRDLSLAPQSEHPADAPVQDFRGPPVGGSTSRRVTCASRDVTGMCREIPPPP